MHVSFEYLKYRREFVEAYIGYLFNQSVDPAFQAFSNGFLKVCGGQVLVSVIFLGMFITTVILHTHTSVQIIFKSGDYLLIMLLYLKYICI